MNWQEKRKLHRQGYRLWVGIGVLILLFFIALVPLFKHVPWQDAVESFKGNSEEFPLAPIPKDDPTRTLSDLLLKKNIPIDSSPSSSGSAIVVTVSGNGQVFFSRVKDIGSQVDSLQIILTRLTIEGKEFKKIDFQYEKPIIVVTD